MAMYKISSTEQHNEKANEYETKSLLFLMTFYKNSASIHYFAIDFFNDLTGINKSLDGCYDVQSKGIDKISPYKMGKFLVTLFKNYLSEFDFCDYILFVQGLSSKITKSLYGKKVFNVSKLCSEIRELVFAGLKAEALSKSMIEDKKQITDKNINNFLNKVTVVIDNNTEEEYISASVGLCGDFSKNEYLRIIFKEIRDKQSCKKNSNLEGKEISSIGCFLNYDKYLTSNEIRLLIINRICFHKAFTSKNEIPVSFVPVYNDIDASSRDDVLHECESDLFKLLTNKNNSNAYWLFFENVLSTIQNNPSDNVKIIYSKINKELMRNTFFLSEISAEYFISLVKENLNDYNRKILDR